MTEETRHRYEKLEDETRVRTNYLALDVRADQPIIVPPDDSYSRIQPVRDCSCGDIPPSEAYKEIPQAHPRPERIAQSMVWFASYSSAHSAKTYRPRCFASANGTCECQAFSHYLEHITRAHVERFQISSILIILHAISHSLHTHSPVPQFLPHPQSALQHLISAIEEHIEQVATSPISSGPSTAQMPSIHSTLLSSSVGESDKVPFPSHASSAGPGSDTTGAKLGFSFAFALAENEAISEAVETLGDIIETCKDLYGVASFIQQEEVELLGDVSSYLHTPVRTPTRSARHSFSAETLRSPSSSSMHDRPTSSRARELRQDLQ